MNQHEIPELDELIYRIETLIASEADVEARRWEEDNLGEEQ